MPVSRMHHPAADVHGRADDAIGVEPFDCEYRTDDVDDRVERADLMQVNLFEGNLMDGRFVFAESMEELLGACLRDCREVRTVDERVDLRQAAVRMVMRDGRRCLDVLMFVIV